MDLPEHAALSRACGLRALQRDAHGWELVDSGWSVLAGDESDQQLEDADAIESGAWSGERSRAERAGTSRSSRR